jgi:hypothetical protein
MIARVFLLFVGSALLTFAGEMVWQWWLGDPCLTQYLEAASGSPPEHGLLGICHYLPHWIDETLSLAAIIVMYVAIGFVFAGRNGRWSIVAALAGVFVGQVGFGFLLSFAMHQTDVWRYGAYSPPSLVECALGSLVGVAVAAGGVWLRRSRTARA